MLKIKLEHDEFFKEKSYVFDLIFSTLGIEYKFIKDLNSLKEDDLLIYYGKYFEENISVKHVFIKDSSKLFNKNYLLCEPDYNVKTFKLKNKIKNIEDIISIFNNGNEFININNKSVYIYSDLISDIFFMVTRYEEVILEDKDNHERFLLEKSLAYKYNFLNRPIVNEQIEFIFDIIKSLDGNIKRKNRLNDKEFIFFLSHDIDSIFKYNDKFIRSLAIKLIKEKSLKNTLNYLSKATKVFINKDKDPFWSFKYLLELENKYNINASYYFMSGGTSNKDNYYNIDNKNLRSVFEEIKNNNSEIGIHGSYNSYNDYNLINSEINKLKKYYSIVGIRQHYLRFSAPETWGIHEKTGLTYDTSLGFAKLAGFRGGICTPYKPFNIKEKKVINIYEIPLVVMDGTICDKEYMNLNKEQALEYVKDLIQRIKNVNGIFSFLWHNSSLDKENYWGEWIDFYEDILKYSSDKALSISGEKIIDLYKK